MDKYIFAGLGAGHTNSHSSVETLEVRISVILAGLPSHNAYLTALNIDMPAISRVNKNSGVTNASRGVSSSRYSWHRSESSDASFRDTGRNLLIAWLHVIFVSGPAWLSGKASHS